MFSTVFVSDQDRSLKFYELLGFEKRADNPGPEGRFVLIGLKGGDHNVILWPGTGGKGTPTPDLPANAAAGVIFLQTDDLRKTFEELKARGVSLLEAKPESYPYGLRATAVDPDGNRVSLRQVSFQ
ncbi:VOC family protein [Edaphobacter albus]|uniref:VOC family protein n=1 Tax=Edaphobacter sp. 4G125 TaxID=2763071 RepID=UPI0021068FA6|nr:VOC family protein [Edaphobacter sp. 4G125]